MLIVVYTYDPKVYVSVKSINILSYDEVTSAKLTIVKYYILYHNRYELVITLLVVFYLGKQAMAYAVLMESPCQ